jgi:hypothetical protein
MVEHLLRPKRKNIPPAVRREVLHRQNYHCAECKTIFVPGDKIEHDHRPALIARPVNDAGDDYDPPQNDPRFIDALHARPCHIKRTIGRQPGAEKTVTTKGSDIWLKTKFDRLEGRTKQRPKAKIPSRPFSKGRGFERRKD